MPVYVVVVVGEVDVAPDATGVEEPIPLSIENDVAFVVVHESVEDEPVWIVAGLAESVHTGAGGTTLTATTAVQVAVPPAPITVPVKVVLDVIVGVVVEPEVTGVTEPMP